MISEDRLENETGKAVRLAGVVREVTLLFARDGEKGGDITLEPGDEVVLIVRSRKRPKRLPLYASKKSRARGSKP
jgi:NhaP-type Na+/H+ and K+/H+ antiporter